MACNGLVGVGNSHTGVKFSKALQNCYKYVANTLLACLHTVSKSDVQNMLCLCLKSIANIGGHLYINVPTFILVLQTGYRYVSHVFVALYKC